MEDELKCIRHVPYSYDLIKLLMRNILIIVYHWCPQRMVFSMASKNEVVHNIEMIDYQISDLLERRRIELEELEVIECFESHWDDR
jgi:hypothetical protein